METDVNKNYDLIIDNPFWVSTILEGSARKKSKALGFAVPDLHNEGLQSISHLYQYSGVPPIAYGKPGSKMMLSIARTREYNRLPLERQQRKIDGIEVGRQFWREEDGTYPLKKIVANWVPSVVKKMAKEFLSNNFEHIVKVAKNTIEDCKNRGPDVLTKGKQTWDPINLVSVPSPTAYFTIEDMIVENLGVSPVNILQYLTCFFDLLKLDQLKYVQTTYSEKPVQKIRRIRGQKVRVNVRIKEKTRKVAEGNEEVRKTVMDWARSFCCYLKHLERAKLDRRAICSGNPFIRMFFYITEYFHLELGKLIEGSTISIGGDLKKAKILNTLGKGLAGEDISHKAQATEDATKWNECLSPEAFAFFHRCLFDDEIRDELGLERCSDEEKLLKEILEMTNYLMAIKRVYIGEGNIVENDDSYGRHEWTIADKTRMNTRTRELFEKVEDWMEDGYLSAPYGMLMGMLNAGSTTFGLVPVDFRSGRYGKTISLRSSDDSTTSFSARSSEDFRCLVDQNMVNLKMVGINMSEKKSSVLREAYGEFTSWFFRGLFISQYGVDVGSLRPQATNPPEDFHNIAIDTWVNQSTHQCNCIGAEARLKIGINNVRRLWGINLDPHKREGISGEVLLMADGGYAMWDCTNCNLEETCFKEHFAQSAEEQLYLRRIRNPDNPFSLPIEEEYQFSRDLSTIVSSTVESPRTCYHYVRRSNASVRSVFRTSEVEVEQNCELANKLYQAVIPYSVVKNPTDLNPMSHGMAQAILMNKNLLLDSGVEMTVEDLARIQRAVTRLS